MPSRLSQNRPAPLVSPELAPPAVAESLLRMHAALTLRELWRALCLLARDAIASDSQTLELGHGPDRVPRKIYRHGHPSTAPELRRAHPDRRWLALRPGSPAYRFSDIVHFHELAGTAFFERVMRREGWDKLLAVISWRGKELLGTFNFFRSPSQPDFSARELRLAEAIQPHFQTALIRVLAHEEAVFRSGHFAAMFEGAPMGHLLLDWDLKPVWLNVEAAHACAVWNHGERKAAALHARRAFRIPPSLAQACSLLRSQWDAVGGAERESALGPRILSDDAHGLHARVVLRSLGPGSVLRPAFEVQLDYRRPRGDRNRAISPGAVALLARLSNREREVAIRVREGMRTGEIATELRRSPLTIKTQIAAIFAKLGVRSRARVAALLNR